MKEDALTVGSKPTAHRMTPLERRAAVSLASIFSIRMLGLFMLFPVISLYQDKLGGATPALIGLAIGVYGLTQGLLQIPFGLLSDRIGRKPVIFMGLCLFALGSVVAAMSDTIYGVIAGRALQGCGAIAAAIMALAADLTREEHRTKAMAMIGMSIGSAFALALVLGPLFDHWVGLSGLFWFTALMAILGMLVLQLMVPNPVRQRLHRDAEPVPAQFGQILRDTQLLRLDVGIFMLHMILTASFVVFPLVLQNVLGMDSSRHWWVYLPVLLISVLAMVPFIIMAERHRRMKKVFLGGILFIGLAQLGLSLWYQHFWLAILFLLIFFTAFNLLEASLPSLVSKIAPPASKGTAMGFYSSSQFLGAFIGGSLGGVLQGQFGFSSVFILCAAMALVWLMLASSMKEPRYLSSYLLNIGEVGPEQAAHLPAQLTAITGVAEAIVIIEDQVAYLKVDNKALDEERLLQFSASDQDT
jgi:predicted MFS family arabinose efflux permease